MTTEPIRTSTATISLGDDGVMRFVVHPGAKETVDTARENIEALTSLAGGMKRPLLVDNRLGRAIELRARQVWGSAEADAVASCTAVLIKPGISRAIGNFMIGVLKPSRPHKLFDSEPDAVAWLKTHLQ
jgi:hypothetical protein